MELEQSLISPKDKREALLTKLNKFKRVQLKDKKYEQEQMKKRIYSELIVRKEILFKGLCNSKFGNLDALTLEQEERNELAVLVYEKSKLPALFQTGFLLCIPLIGWISLLCLLSVWPNAIGDEGAFKNLRYYWWTKRISKMKTDNKYREV